MRRYWDADMGELERSAWGLVEEAEAEIESITVEALEQELNESEDERKN